MTRRFVFLGGCARSGTSALHRILQGQPRLFLGLERYVRLARTPERFLPGLFEPERFLRIEPGDTFYDTLDHFPAHRDAARRLAEAEMVGDKIPMIAPLYGQIAAHFPGARIVFILRNVHDVAASFVRRAADAGDRTWAARRDHRAACEEWNLALRETLAWRDRLPIHILQYEDVFRGRGDLDALADFLDLDRAILARRARAVLEAAPQTAARPDALSGEQKRHIALHADFAAYRALVAAAPAAPAAAPPRPPGKYGEDAAILDYQPWRPKGARAWVRGPAPEAPPAIAFLGAASCFGRYVAAPYAALLGRRLGVPVANLGHGGARAPLYLKDAGLLAAARSARVVVVEMFSARGTDTEETEAKDHASAFLRRRGTAGPFTFADRFYADLLATRPPEAMAALREALRAAYRREMEALLAALGRPVLLFYFSQRPADAPFGLDSAAAYMGGFPHFVDAALVEGLAARAARHVALVSRSGLPQPLLRRDTGAPLAGPRGPLVNSYYPSPQMHAEAAAALEPVLREMLAAAPG